MNKYKNFGVMLDVSRNAVMNVETLKTFINCLEKMGYDTLELYAEDTYKLDDEPYFGYQRGGYTSEELKEIDAYCKEHGIELIPCVQTLAHFTNLARIPHYQDIIDANDILLIDEPKTYALIEKIFANCAKNFTSKKINIGMDEAHFVGLGKYLDKHGYTNRFKLLCKHLTKVCEIAEKYGFKPHMWSDMFFRLYQNGGYTQVNPELAAKFDQELIDAIPDNVELAYWNYYHTEKEIYDFMFGQHRKLNKEIWFAGGAWVWSGFAPNNYFSIATMKPAMQSVIENGIDKVLITLWGDNGKECSSFAALPVLYAIRQYGNGNFDDKKIAMDFEKLFGVPFDDFMTLDLPDHSRFVEEYGNVQNASKIFLYQDCFMGIYDDVIEKEGKIDYACYANRIFKAGEKTPEFKYIFDCLGNLCLVLDKKMMLGVETRKLYKAKDKQGLLALTKTYEEVIVLIKQFHKSFKKLWFKENKPFGWEIQDARIGGVICRVETCKERLEAFIKGEISSIPELEEDILEFGAEGGPGYRLNIYTAIISRSSMCWNLL